MAAPRTMFDHVLNGLRGWPSQSAVTFEAELSSEVTIDPLPAGRCVHLNAGGKYETGCPAGVGKIFMPIFIFQYSDDYDVANDGGIENPGGWMSFNRPRIMGLVASGAYELETTEYDKQVTYEPNDALKSAQANTTAATGGVLSKGTPYTDPIVGIVSRGVKTLEQSNYVQALAFWPFVLPPTPGG